MRLTLLCVGRLKAGPERELFERYLKRIRESARLAGIAGADVRETEESRARRPDGRREEESAGILSATPRGAYLVVLDSGGQWLTSEDWAADIASARDASRPVYAVVVGGPDGLSASLRDRADRLVSFGAMTWPHQLARVMAGEQLYRALLILAGHPYHRG